MIVDYLNAALDRATYEIIADEEPYYGEIPGVATQKTSIRSDEILGMSCIVIA